MKKILIGLMLILSTTAYGVVYSQSELLTAQQEYTTSWADLGSEINALGHDKLAVYLEQISETTATGLQIRALAKLSSGGSLEYSLPIKTVSAASVDVQDEVIGLEEKDLNIALGIDIDGLVPFVQFQIKATSVGTPNTAYINQATVVLGSDKSGSAN